MNLAEWAKAVHQNAAEHGWWETVDLDGIIDLIHDEWSEALEEDRNGRPDVYAIDPNDDDNLILRNPDAFGGAKPEGVLIELIDGCIRILDMMSWYGLYIDMPNLYDKPQTFRRLIRDLHSSTAKAGDLISSDGSIRNGSTMGQHLRHCLALAFWWIEKRGHDPYRLMALKHEYNKTRPYKHGKLY